MIFSSRSKNTPYKTRDFLQIANPDNASHVGKRVSEPQGQLHSTFALDQLTNLAKNSEPAEFLLTMASIFGFDIPAHTYVKLYQALYTGDVKNPTYRVESTGIYPSDYDNLDRTIRIHPAALDYVIEHPDSAWELLAILLHEFGHHLDNVLRQDLADKNPDGTPIVAKDAQHEEGSRYAYQMALFGSSSKIKNGTEIATCIAPRTGEVVISTGYFHAMDMIRQTQANGALHPHNRDVENGREGFESGSGSESKSTHQTIEEVLRPLGFDALDLDVIYFGNWLRDYSQLLDPKIVRATTMPKNLPEVLSREALTEIVDVLSVGKFKYLRSSLPGAFTVTPKRLGVYRPSQHIDNPKAVNPTPADPTSRDPDFEPWVLPGDPLLEVDPDTSMKRYIQRSVVVMQEELKAAMHNRDVDGLKLFGSALHILEDFFAHSNFVELSLIKAGYESVLPWTSKADCKWGLPVVTGTFSGNDVIASLAAPISEVLFKTEDLAFKPTQVGERSERDQIILILLKERESTDLLEIYETFLSNRDKWASWEGSEYVERYFWFTGHPATLLKNAFNTAMQGILRLIGNSIDDVQTLSDDPNTNGSTDPSHSQLAKDHAEHPLHSLAALLAKEAVKQVAQTMVEHWEGNRDADPAAIATAYFTHPMDSTWQDAVVKDWAVANPERVSRSTSKNELDKLHDELNRVGEQTKERLENETSHFLDFVFGGLPDKESIFDLVAEHTALGPLFKANADKQQSNDKS